MESHLVHLRQRPMHYDHHHHRHQQQKCHGLVHRAVRVSNSGFSADYIQSTLRKLDDPLPFVKGYLQCKLGQRLPSDEDDDVALDHSFVKTCRNDTNRPVQDLRNPFDKLSWGGCASGTIEAIGVFLGLAEHCAKAVTERNSGGGGENWGSGGGQGNGGGGFGAGSGDGWGDWRWSWPLSNIIASEEEAEEANGCGELKTWINDICTILTCIIDTCIHIFQRRFLVSEETVDQGTIWKNEYHDAIGPYQAYGIVHEEHVSDDYSLIALQGFGEAFMLDSHESTLSGSKTMDDQSASSFIFKQTKDVAPWPFGLMGKQRGSEVPSLKEDNATQEKVKDLANEAIAAALKQLTEAGGSSPLAKRSDIETLKRLQREAFSDLLKLRERLEKIEQSRKSGQSDGAARTRLKGEVKAGTAFVMMEDTSSRHSRNALEQAGMLSGLDVQFSFETSFREKDLLITQCVAGQGSSVGDGRALGGPITLGKLHYVAQLNDDVSLSFVPFGAQGKDMTEIINPLQDQGLTLFSSHGPALFNYCKGSAFGATVSGSKFAFSLAQYLSGWGNHFSSGWPPGEAEKDPLCLTSLGQFLLQPSEGLIFSFAGLSRYWPTPPFPSSVGLHWSEMGPLVIPKIRSSTNKHDLGVHNPHNFMDDNLESKGTSLLSLAVATEMDVSENVSVGVWAQIERGDLLQDSDKGSFQWALNVSKTSGSGIGWGASFGSSRPDFWSLATSEQEVYPEYSGSSGHSYDPQTHVEAFLRLNCGRGFTLQPGLLFLTNKQSHTPALIVRSSWSL